MRKKYRGQMNWQDVLLLLLAVAAFVPFAVITGLLGQRGAANKQVVKAMRPRNVSHEMEDRLA